MGKPYGDLPHSDPARLTDSAEEYAAPSEAKELTDHIFEYLGEWDEENMDYVESVIAETIKQAVAAERARLAGWLDFKIAAAQRAAEKVRQQDAYTSDYETYAEAITAAFNEVVEHLKQ